MMINMQTEVSTEPKSTTPNTSPRGSPKPSPRPQLKQEHGTGDSFLTVNYKEQMNASFLRNDSSPGQESNTSSRSSNLESIAYDLNATKERKDLPRNVEKTKKKSAWYNALYPTYKSKSEDFKRIFKDVPDDERLVVDYSCALQKDILVHGRLYVSQNFLCFYANIFRWETNVTIKWKDVSAITKEKTALVIPNAVLISTQSEKYFFTSFATRDKTYLTLFRAWQRALLDQPMPNAELWQWVHHCYGEELGLTSDDDDYIQPGTEDEKLSSTVATETITESDFATTNTDASVPEQFLMEEQMMYEKNVIPMAAEIQNGVLDNHIPTDLSDTTESDAEKASRPEVPAVCTSLHEGRPLLNEIYPLHVDQLFTLLFTSSKFYLDLHASRKTTDLAQSDWTHNSVDNTKTRVVNLTIALNQTVGPKTCPVTETQVMLPCSRAGSLYSIDIESINAGIPYADSFSVALHYCIQMVSEVQSSLIVYVQIKYRKSVWGLVKTFIEKNCWQGLENYFKCLSTALWIECGDSIPAVKRKSRRRRRVHSLHKQEMDISHHTATGARTSIKVSSSGVFSSDIATLIVFGVLILLVVLNVMLYYKLWLLEDTPLYKPIDLHVLKDPPKSHDEWINLLQKQETLHSLEMQRWQKVLKTSIDLLKQIEVQLNELQHSIHPTYTNKIMSIIQNHKDTVNEAQEL